VERKRSITKRKHRREKEGQEPGGIEGTREGGQGGRDAWEGEGNLECNGRTRARSGGRSLFLLVCERFGYAPQKSAFKPQGDE